MIVRIMINNDYDTFASSEFSLLGPVAYEVLHGVRHSCDVNSW